MVPQVSNSFWEEAHPIHFEQAKDAKVIGLEWIPSSKTDEEM